MALQTTVIQRLNQINDKRFAREVRKALEVMFDPDGTAEWIPFIVNLTATDATRNIAIPHVPMRFKAVSRTFTTASTSGTLQVEKCTGTTAPGSGIALLTGTVSLAGAANTVVSGTPIATIASLNFAAGDRLGIVIAGTMTNLVGGIATIWMTPL